ncbi:unnamed protein product [Amoebophrya sp. A25]|nr:unnamed protein product [Amoebophrya sp. A25]|eukprot:GSA25T00007666001.1
MARFFKHDWGYTWLRFVAFFTTSSMEFNISLFLVTIILILGFISYAAHAFVLFWPCLFLASILIYLQLNPALSALDTNESFGDFYVTKERLGCPGGISRSALDTSWEPGPPTGKTGDRSFRHVFIEKNTNRQVFLRGLNVGGGTKLPQGWTSDMPLEEDFQNENEEQSSSIARGRGDQSPVTQRRTKKDERETIGSASLIAVGSEAESSGSDGYAGVRGGAANTNKVRPAQESRPGGAGRRKCPSTAPSFVNRPFPLEEADVHFSRLLAYGFTFFRLCITWEAVEPMGPGEYDRDYLNYLEALLASAREYGISVFIDFHQDVWSRWTGGSGAPRWTLEVIGFDTNFFRDTLAAWRHCDDAKNYPMMCWANNYLHLACATMFTLFFGGDDFAPNFRLNRKCSRLYCGDAQEPLDIKQGLTINKDGKHEAEASKHQLDGETSTKGSNSKVTDVNILIDEASRVTSKAFAEGEDLLGFTTAEQTGDEAPDPGTATSLQNSKVALDTASNYEGEHMAVNLVDGEGNSPKTAKFQGGVPPSSMHSISSEDLPYYLLNPPEQGGDAASPLFASSDLDANFVTAQQFLQDHYLGAARQVAAAVKHLDNVLGFDTLNEPDYGFLGYEDIGEWRSLGGAKTPSGFVFSAFEAMALGSGCSLPVDYFSGVMQFARTIEFANPSRKTCWRQGYECIWKQHGIYDLSPVNQSPVLKKPSHFSRNPRSGDPVDVHADYMIPFWDKFAQAIRDEMGSDIFVFCSPFPCPTDQKTMCYSEVTAHSLRKHPNLERKAVFSPHYYEGWQLMYHKWRPYICINSSALIRLTVEQAAIEGDARILKKRDEDLQEGHEPSSSVEIQEKGSKSCGRWCRRACNVIRNLPVYIGTQAQCARQVGRDIALAASHGKKLGPAVIGEIGISMNIEGEANLSRCFDRQMRGLEHSGVSGYTLWHYCPDATINNDGWNKEHLSIFTNDLVFPNATPFLGGRALPAIIRPSPFLVAGRIRKFSFDALSHKRMFELEYEEVATCRTNQTILFVPYYQYSEEGVRTRCSDGQFIETNLLSQKFTYVHDTGIAPNAEGKRVHKIQIWLEGGRRSGCCPCLPSSFEHAGV